MSSSPSRCMALPEGERMGLREKARARYRGSAGERQRVLQYLKCLKCNRIKDPGDALERHGIEFVNVEYTVRSAA